MTQIVVPAGLEQQFTISAQSAEVRDTQGHLLGHFMPSERSVALATLDITEEEIERRFAEEGGRTLEEIWADLRKREAQG
jgi:hypothetical protein